MKFKLSEEYKDEWRQFLSTLEGKEAFIEVIEQIEEHLTANFLGLPTDAGSEKLYVEKAKLEGANRVFRILRDLRKELTKE